MAAKTGMTINASDARHAPIEINPSDETHMLEPSSVSRSGARTSQTAHRKHRATRSQMITLI